MIKRALLVMTLLQSPSCRVGPNGAVLSMFPVRGKKWVLHHCPESSLATVQLMEKFLVWVVRDGTRGASTHLPIKATNGIRCLSATPWV